MFLWSTTPSFSSWPLTSGYTFCLWLRIESFSDPTSRENYRPCIYSFLNNEGFGVEVFFLQNTLIAQTRQGKSSSKSFVRLNFVFKEKIWYFLAITHVYHFFTTSEITLFVDGKQVDSQQLVYPKFDKAPEFCFIGTNSIASNSTLSLPSQDSSTNSKIESSPTMSGAATERSQPIFGQVGQILLFQEGWGKTKLIKFIIWDLVSNQS